MIKILNTLSGQKEEFVPLKGKNVNMFVCGPTVYDYMHIGNARTFVFFDVLAKYLRFRGHDVNYIQNVTDIDDKIIARAAERGISPRDLAKEFEAAFLEDLKSLGITAVSSFPPATDHIPEVIAQAQTFLDKS